MEGFVPETFFPPPGKLEIVNKGEKCIFGGIVGNERIS